jgi:hypothetical protein
MPANIPGCRNPAKRSFLRGTHATPPILIFALAAMLGGCISVSRDATPPVSAAASSPGSILERVYVGRNIPGGGFVSDPDWTKFLAEIVTPRFPAGFTVIADEGSWREQTGNIAREPGFILEIIHPDTPATNQAVREIALEYQRRFKQEAVLRVREHVEATF